MTRTFNAGRRSYTITDRHGIVQSVERRAEKLIVNCGGSARSIETQNALVTAEDGNEWRMSIRRPAGCFGIDPAEPKLSQIQFVDKDVDHPNGIVLANPVLQTFRKQRVLAAIRPLNEAPHLSPPQIARESYRQNQIQQRVFTQPGPEAETKPNELVHVCFGRYLRIMTCSVLLDLDGTLIDSYPGILASCLAALRTLGHEPDETLDIRRTIGPPLEDMMQILLQSYGDDRVGEAVAAYRRHYGEIGLLGSVPYPGIGKSLEEMKRTGLRIYLATSKRVIFASRILDHLKFATYFDGIHGSVPSGELDHKPELLAHILSKHGLSPSHSLMVGDRRQDISGAHAVGMRGLGVLWGYGTRDELETAGADQLVESPADLARTVLSMVNGKESPG